MSSFDKKLYTPSYVLNESRGFFGLASTDFFISGIFFVLWINLFSSTSIENFGVLFSLLLLAFLSPIRLKKRRKIIRDYFASLFTSKKIYDPSRNIRNSRV